jgi:hypothetical protein
MRLWAIGFPYTFAPWWVPLVPTVALLIFWVLARRDARKRRAQNERRRSR